MLQSCGERKVDSVERRGCKKDCSLRLQSVDRLGHLTTYLTISAVEEEKEPCPPDTDSVPSRVSDIRGRFVVAESVNFKGVQGDEAAAGGSWQQRKDDCL